MSVYQERISQWQKEWNSVSKGSNLGKDYLAQKIDFINTKLEALKESNPWEFSQFCDDFASVQQRKGKIWSVANAGVLGVGVGTAVSALLGAVALTPLFVGVLGAVIVAKAVTFCKNRRYKATNTLIKAWRGKDEKVKYFKFFRKDKSKGHFINTTRDEFLNSADYLDFKKRSQIPQAIEDNFIEKYELSRDVVPVGATNVETVKTKDEIKNEWYSKNLPTTTTTPEKPKSRNWYKILSVAALVLLSALKSSNNNNTSSVSTKTPVIIGDKGKTL